MIDATTTLSWLFEDERTNASDAVLDQVGSGAVVPSVWKLEMTNGLQKAIRRRRIDRIFRDDAIRRLALLTITLDPDTDANAWTASLRLADRFDLTIYDATYLDLAQRLGVPLARLDQGLLDQGLLDQGLLDQGLLDQGLRRAGEVLGMTLVGA